MYSDNGGILVQRAIFVYTTFGILLIAALVMLGFICWMIWLNRGITPVIFAPVIAFIMVIWALKKTVLVEPAIAANTTEVHWGRTAAFLTIIVVALLSELYFLSRYQPH